MDAARTGDTLYVQDRYRRDKGPRSSLGALCPIAAVRDISQRCLNQMPYPSGRTTVQLDPDRRSVQTRITHRRTQALAPEEPAGARRHRSEDGWLKTPAGLRPAVDGALQDKHRPHAAGGCKIRGTDRQWTRLRSARIYSGSALFSILALHRSFKHEMRCEQPGLVKFELLWAQKTCTVIVRNGRSIPRSRGGRAGILNISPSDGRCSFYDHPPAGG